MAKKAEFPSLSSPTFFFEMGFLTEPGTYKLARMTGHQALNIPLEATLGLGLKE